MNLEQLEKSIWPGDIVLTRSPGSWLGGLILAGQASQSGNTAYWGHAMRAVETGFVISQDLKVNKRPLSDFVSKKKKPTWILVWRNTRYSNEDRETLVELAHMSLGRGYDFVGLLGQGLRILPIIGSFLGKYFQLPWATFCSEMICEHEKRVNPNFMTGFDSCRVSPEDIDTYCRENQPEWKRMVIYI